MTFIASVVAKDGVAIIADSLVTASHYVIEFEDFLAYLEAQRSSADSQKIDTIELKEDDMLELFKMQTYYTKDYENKLFKLDKYTAITTAGLAIVNEKRISKIIEEIIAKTHRDRSIEEKVRFFCSSLNEEVKEHLQKDKNIRGSTFLITHYEPVEQKTTIFTIRIKDANRESLEQNEEDFVYYVVEPEFNKVACEGQNRISERILYGDMRYFAEIVSKVANTVIDDFDINKDKIPEGYFVGLRNKMMTPQIKEDAKVFKLTDLSLQQAVDLAYLLMRIEIDFQKYTENIPTVGGVIKLATIDKDGFKYISGNDIVKPKS